MGDLIPLAKAVTPGRSVANRRASPHGHAARDAARSDVGLRGPEDRRHVVALDGRLSARPAFFFDLACPLSYIAADRVERLLGDIEWVPTPSELVRDDAPAWDTLRAQATALARAGRLPLIWPERFPSPVPRALRVAAFAAEVGMGARFALAASRLAFCGGFDLEEPSVLPDVADAAGLSLPDCLIAADEQWRDDDLSAAAHKVRSLGATRLPVVSVAGRWFDGLHALSEAAGWLSRA